MDQRFTLLVILTTIYSTILPVSPLMERALYNKLYDKGHPGWAHYILKKKPHYVRKDDVNEIQTDLSIYDGSLFKELCNITLRGNIIDPPRPDLMAAIMVSHPQGKRNRTRYNHTKHSTCLSDTQTPLFTIINTNRTDLLRTLLQPFNRSWTTIRAEGLSNVENMRRLLLATDTTRSGMHGSTLAAAIDVATCTNDTSMIDTLCQEASKHNLIEALMREGYRTSYNLTPLMVAIDCAAHRNTSSILKNIYEHAYNNQILEKITCDEVFITGRNDTQRTPIMRAIDIGIRTGNMNPLATMCQLLQRRETQSVYRSAITQRIHPRVSEMTPLIYALQEAERTGETRPIAVICHETNQPDLLEWVLSQRETKASQKRLQDHTPLMMAIDNMSTISAAIMLDRAQQRGRAHPLDIICHAAEHNGCIHTIFSHRGKKIYSEGGMQFTPSNNYTPIMLALQAAYTNRDTYPLKRMCHIAHNNNILQDILTTTGGPQSTTPFDMAIDWTAQSGLLQPLLILCDAAYEYHKLTEIWNQTRWWQWSAWNKRHSYNKEHFGSRLKGALATIETYSLQSTHDSVRPSSAVMLVDDLISQAALYGYTKEHTKEETCVICTDALTEEKATSNDIKELQCGHAFHRPCIRKWFLYKPQCPMCRSSLIE